MRRLVLPCLLVGVVAGLGAALFFTLLEAFSSLCLGYLAHYAPAGPGREQSLFVLFEGGGPALRWMLLLLPIAGGLLSGLLVFSLAPEAEGHGTDAAIEAYHYRDGAVRARVPLIKTLASMITIGSGGSGGREGPIAQIGSGFASMVGRWFKLAAAERRVLMAAGMGAGIGAIFHAPLAGALFASEVLYQGPDLEHEVLVPGFITSVVAYGVFGAIFGFHPLFLTPDYHFGQPLMLLPYLLLAGVCTAGAIGYVHAFYGFRHLMFGRRLRLPPHLKPAIGGLLVGIVGYFMPEALATGYGVVQACFNVDLGHGPALLALPSAGAFGALAARLHAPALAAALLLLVIAFTKTATTAFSIGSGGSGGVFGPAVVVGGALGGATGLVCQLLFPTLPVKVGAFALVGMAGFFAGAANTPISTIIMVSEMTGSYDLLLPAMLVCVVSYLLCRRHTLYCKQLPSREEAPSKLGHMVRALLHMLTVGQAVAARGERKLTVIAANTPLREVATIVERSEQECFPVVDDHGRMRGVLHAEDLRQLMQESDAAPLVIAHDLMGPIEAVTLDDSLLAPVNLMALTGRKVLVVVDPQDSFRPVDTLSDADMLTAYNQQVVATG